MTRKAKPPHLSLGAARPKTRPYTTVKPQLSEQTRRGKPKESQELEPVERATGLLVQLQTLGLGFWVQGLGFRA